MDAILSCDDYIRVDMISGAICFGTVIAYGNGWVQMHCDRLRRGTHDDEVDQDIYLNLAHACAIWPMDEDCNGKDHCDDEDDDD